MSQFLVRSRIGCNKCLYLEARSLELLLPAWEGIIRKIISAKTQPKHDFEVDKEVDKEKTKEFPAILLSLRACVLFWTADQKRSKTNKARSERQKFGLESMNNDKF